MDKEAMKERQISSIMERLRDMQETRCKLLSNTASVR